MRAAVVFSSKQGQRRWWNLFTGRKFAHCWAVFENNGVVVSINPLIWGVQVSILNMTLAEYLQGVRTNPLFAAAFEMELEYLPTDRAVYRGLYSCVSITKAVLGINDWRILTPKQLHDFFERIKNGRYS